MAFRRKTPARLRRKKISITFLVGSLFWLIFGAIFWNEIVFYVFYKLPGEWIISAKLFSGLIIVSPGIFQFLRELYRKTNQLNTALVVPEAETQQALSDLAEWADDAIMVKCPLRTFKDDLHYEAIWKDAFKKRKNFFFLHLRQPIKVYYVDISQDKVEEWENICSKLRVESNTFVNIDAKEDPEHYTVWRRHKFGKVETIVTIGWKYHSLDLVIADGTVSWVADLSKKASGYICT